MNSPLETLPSISAKHYLQGRPIRHAGAIVQGMSVADAFATLTSPLIDQAEQHAGILHESAEPESLHKLRVTLRRLRTLWWAYGPLVDTADAREHRHEFKALADAAGSTRSWDVLRAVLAENVALRPALEQLTDELDVLRQSALMQSRQTLLQADIGRLLQERRASILSQLDAQTFHDPLTFFATQRIDAATRALQKRIWRAQSACLTDSERLHEVRIAGKKLRYLLEFFAPVMVDTLRVSIEELTLVQDELGKLNDVVCSGDLLRAFAVQFRDSAAVEYAIASLTKIKARRIAHADELIRSVVRQGQIDTGDA